MVDTAGMQRKERLGRISLTVISLIGIWVFFQFGLLKLTSLNMPLTFGLLVAFLLIVELFPLPVWKGHTSISFPLVYAIVVVDGIAYAIISFALVSAAINLLKRRALRIVFFNPAQLIISLYAAYLMSELFSYAFPYDHQPKVLIGIIHFLTFIAPFYLINNLIVDIILVIRPQKYSLKAWRQKMIQEMNSFLISAGYLVLFNVLGNQNRPIDVISFFFFFAPLVCFALLSSIITNLKKEKAKLKALFSILSELNKKIAAQEWLSFLKDNLHEFINVEAWILWKKENGHWKLKFADGMVDKDLQLSPETELSFNDMQGLGLKVYHDSKKDGGPAAIFFEDEVRSLLYAPLILESELVGLFVFGRIRTRSFTEEDLPHAATLANQMAVLIKTKWLFAEQEKRLILEERNRIARDIHDGVAQSLAGAIMNLETAARKFSRLPEDSLRLVQESTSKLRCSLKEVRESIYALRPYPTERVGLLPAISTRVEAIQKESHIPIMLEKRGTEFTLSSMVEKIIFDIFQESTQNSIKHAKASKIEILLSFQKENVLLRVKDDGIGFSLFQAMIKAQKNPHFGILNMNEAAEKIKASLQIDSKVGTGTEITLTIPLLGIEGGVMYDKAYAGR